MTHWQRLLLRERKLRYREMILVLVEAVRSISIAVEEINIERGDIMVELDQFKFTLNGYQKPLEELRDSL